MMLLYALAFLLTVITFIICAMATWYAREAEMWRQQYYETRRELRLLQSGQ